MASTYRIKSTPLKDDGWSVVITMMIASREKDFGFVIMKSEVGSAEEAEVEAIRRLKVSLLTASNAL